jgi:general secretion pathway protein N
MAREALWPVCLAALLSVAVLAEILAPAEVSAPLPAPRENAAATAAQGDAASLTASWAAAILARPIFRPDRRPLEAAPVAQAAMPRLTAIVITADGASAIFVGDDGTAVSVKAGGLVDGQTVKSIAASGVTLGSPGGVTILRPQFGAAVGGPGTAAGAPAAGAPTAEAPGPVIPATGFPPSPAVPLAGIPNNVDR